MPRLPPCRRAIFPHSILARSLACGSNFVKVRNGHRPGSIGPNATRRDHPPGEGNYAALQPKRCENSPRFGFEESVHPFKGSDAASRLVAQGVVAVGSSKAGRARAHRSRIELPGMARATAPQQRGGEAKRLPRKRVSPPHISIAMQDVTTGVKSHGQDRARLDGKSDFAAYLAASEACWESSRPGGSKGDADERINRSNGPIG